MNKFRRLTKVFAVHAMIFSLLQTTFVFSVQAQTNNETVNNIRSIAMNSLDIYSKYLGMKQNIVMQTINSQKNAQMMQTMSPNCRKADGTSCYTVAGKFFPECPLPASMSTMPQNVCSSMSPDPNQIASMITYESIAKSWVNYFNQMSNEASNEAVPFGLKCLQDKKKALDSQLIEMGNNLTRLQDQLNKDKETFRANNKKILEELATTNDELMGASGTGKNNLKLKTTDFSKFFSQSCQSVIGDSMKDGANMGLIGIMHSLSPKGKEAADYNNNRAMIESEVRADIQRIQNAITQSGIEDFQTKGAAETTKYKSVEGAIQKKIVDFGVAKDRIAKELSKIGYTIPTMDKNFSVDFEEFLSSSQDFFKKQYINSCVTGEDKSGIALSSEQILNSLQQRTTKNAGTARDKYRAALKTILESDAFIDTKLAQMKALEGTYQDITITYQNTEAQRVTETPYDLYMRTLKKCETRLTQSDQFTSKGSAGVSQAKKIERGQALLRELKSLHDTYTSDMGTRVLNKVLTCDGESKKSGANCGDKASFDYTSANFCLAQSNQCANEVLACNSEATKHVEQRKTRMEALASAYNHRVEAYITHANSLYTQQKNAVMDMIKIVQARFPGTNFAIPEGMFVSMPEMKKDSFGVDLANDGNLSFMDDFPKKIGLLKQVFADQQKKVDSEIDDYIDKQTAAMEKEKGRWQELAGECKGNIDSSSRELAKMNADGQKKQMEQDQGVARYCEKYNEMRDNPVGGCDDAKELASDMQKISARLTPGAKSFASQYKAACNAYNNEKDMLGSVESCEGLKGKELSNCNTRQELILKQIKRSNASEPEKTEKIRPVNLNSLCKKNDENVSNDEFLNGVIAKLGKSERQRFEDSDKKKELLKAFKSGGSDLEKFVDENRIEDSDVLVNFRNITSLKGDEKICDNLMKINNPDESSAVADAEAKSEKAQSELQAKVDVVNKDIDKQTRQEKEDLTNLRTAAREAESNLKKINAKMSTKEKADKEKQENLKNILIALSTASTPPKVSLKGQQLDDLNRIGQQATEACDAQASNVNIPKNIFSNSIVPAGFDEAILKR